MAENDEVQRLYYDLLDRGGKWVTAATEFWQAVNAAGSKAKPYDIYLEIHKRYAGEAFLPSGVSHPSGVKSEPPPNATPETYAKWYNSLPPEERGKWMTPEAFNSWYKGAGPGRLIWPTGEFAASFPQAAWEKAFELPSFGQNPFQQWLASQAAPAYAGWLGREILPGATPSTFESFLSQEGMGQAGATGLGALRQAKGLLPEEKEQWLSEFQGGEGGIASLSALMRGALGAGGRGFASPVANIMARRLPGLQGAWLKETGAGATGPTFLDYLMQRYGLG